MTLTVSNPNEVALVPSSTVTVSGNGAGEDVSQYTEGLVTLDVTAASGTSPTLAVKIQTSDDGGTTWYDIPNASFTQATAVTKQAIQINTYGNLIRAAYTVGGTTPSFTFTVNAILKHD